MVISERVSVPVLSVQITDAAPRVSTDDRRLMMALLRAMRSMPKASTSDRMAGSPSGTAATARDTPSNSTLSTSSTVSTGMSISTATTTTMLISRTAMPSIRPMARTSFCRGVTSSGVTSNK
ncbi:hypothetical protein D3C76_1113540 [compost metagenome]